MQICSCLGKNGENDIYTENFIIQQIERRKTYPVVIMSHGASVTHEFYEKAQWTNYVNGLGYICYAYDFVVVQNKVKAV